jgi:hypothetical protein
VRGLAAGLGAVSRGLENVSNGTVKGVVRSFQALLVEVVATVVMMSKSGGHGK